MEMEDAAAVEADTEQPRSPAPPPPKLTELQASRLETFEWKMRSHVGRVRIAEAEVQSRRAELAAVQKEWGDACRALGVDPSRAFSVGPDGVVSYSKKK